MNIENEPDYIYQMYAGRMPSRHLRRQLHIGTAPGGKGVRFIQLYHMGWDQHDNLPEAIQKRIKMSTRLRQRWSWTSNSGVCWKIPWSSGAGSSVHQLFSRHPDRHQLWCDHHPRMFYHLDGGRRGKAHLVYGETDDFGYNIVDKPMHVHDLQATLLHLLGIDHERLTYKYQVIASG